MVRTYNQTVALVTFYGIKHSVTLKYKISSNGLIRKGCPKKVSEHYQAITIEDSLFIIVFMIMSKWMKLERIFEMFENAFQKF